MTGVEPPRSTPAREGFDTLRPSSPQLGARGKKQVALPDETLPTRMPTPNSNSPLMSLAMRERSPSQLTAKPRVICAPTEDLQGRAPAISVLPPPALRNLPGLAGGVGEGTRVLSIANPRVPQRQGQPQTSLRAAANPYSGQDTSFPGCSQGVCGIFAQLSNYLIKKKKSPSDCFYCI